MMPVTIRQCLEQLEEMETLAPRGTKRIKADLRQCTSGDLRRVKRRMDAIHERLYSLAIKIDDILEWRTE